MNKTNPKVDEFLSNAKRWKKEIKALRAILLDCELTEDFKWRGPCYTYKNSNVVIINGFKEYGALGFFKGILMKDRDELLVKPGDNTQSARMIKFRSMEDIHRMGSILKSYILAAVEIEKAGLKVEFKESKAYALAEELQVKFENMPHFRQAFEALTPGRQ